MNWQDQIIEAADTGGDISCRNVIEILKPYISTLEQAIVLCDSTDPNHPVMSRGLYTKAMKMIEDQDENY